MEALLHEQLWAECTQIIKDNLQSELTFNTWFEPIKPISVENNVLTVQVPSPFYYEYIEAHFIDLLSKALRRILGPEAKLEYRVVMGQPTQADHQVRTMHQSSKNTTNLSNKLYPQPFMATPPIL